MKKQELFIQIEEQAEKQQSPESNSPPPDLNKKLTESQGFGDDIFKSIQEDHFYTVQEDIEGANVEFHQKSIGENDPEIDLEKEFQSQMEKAGVDLKEVNQSSDAQIDDDVLIEQ